ncbi:MAG: hypothetical protein FJW34_12970 [Acidobacteria bacterium]|nr:hypothetical protein [Acidobacteriota bacterium]
MRRLTTEASITLIVVGCLMTIQAAGPAIGVVVTRGSFRIDNSTVWGNGTLFDGTTIETGQASSDLKMSCGARLALAAESRGTVYRDRLVLERGAGQLTGDGAYRMEARSLRILAVTPEASAQVVLTGPDRVQVAALLGPLRVTNDAGVVVANIAAGKALEFEPQAAGAGAPSQLVGTLERRDDHFLLTDRTAAVTVELQGPGLAREVGQCIEVTGTLAAGAQAFSPATQVIRVTQMKRCSKETAAAVAGAGPGAAAAGAGAAGMTATTKAIIVGVVVAGAATGTAIALTGEEEKKPLSP